MSKFDTNGGYFAPKDYLRVNEGGSHEENPNGGVQIGVDPEGNPNLLEEGEPVYKDYVYSDNIEAEREFLEQNHLPTKYEGKLYSKIADDLFTEAEERPLDPISRNGLEVLLGRLADAQEGQKQAKEQRDLEDELAQLSPEELDQLEAMLAQGQSVGTDNSMYGEGPVGAQGESGIPPGQMMEPAESMPVEGMPMMSYGGTLLRRFDMGGPKDDRLQAAQQAAAELGPKMDGEPVQVPSLLEMALGSDNKIVQGINSVSDAYNDWKDNSTVGGIVDALLPRDLTEAAGTPVTRGIKRVAGPFSRGIKRAAKSVGQAIKNAPKKLIEKEGREIMRQQAAAAAKEAKAVAKSTFDEAQAIASELDAAQLALKEAPTDPALLQKVSELEAKSRKADAVARGARARSIGKDIESAATHIESYTVGPMRNYASYEKEVEGFRKAYEGAKKAAEAAPKDKALQEAAETALKNLEKAESGWNKWWNHGEWHYKGATVGIGAAAAAAAGHEHAKQNWAEEQFKNIRANGGNLFWPGGPYRRYTDPNYAGYLYDNAKPYMYDPDYVNQADIPLTVQAMAEQLYDSAAAKKSAASATSGTASRATSRTGTRTSSASSPTQGAAAASNAWYDAIDPTNTLEPTYVYEQGPVNPNLRYIIPDPNPAGLKIVPRPITNLQETGAVGDNTDDKDFSSDDIRERGLLPTWPRYAGAIGSGLLGLYDVFQQPDRYAQERINPQLPEGRINLQNQAYNPIDQNIVANAQIAQGNATNRALRNSGLGPSSAAAILAADNNTTGNLGTGFLQTWDANNQRRNAVIAANNQAEAQRAQFDYAVDAARKQALNDARIRNAQNNLLIQRLNNEAEGEKYSSISNQINAGLQALSGIGQENFAMNQINTNPAFIGYGTGASGGIYYNPLTGKMEIIPQIPDGNTNEKKTATKTTAPLFNFNYGKRFSPGEPTLFPGV